MRPINVVLAHHDAVAVDRLAASLGKQFRNLAIAKSTEEIAPAVARFRAPFAVVDLELVGFSELKALCSKFPSTAFVCIHRLADDRMWSGALGYGRGGLLSRQRPPGHPAGLGALRSAHSVAGRGGMNS